MDKINLSTQKPKMNVGGTTTKEHNKLKNLDFEHSGHTGFQKKLSVEILKILEEMLGGCISLDDGSGGKMRIYYDAIDASPNCTLNLNLGGGSIENCTDAKIEGLRFLDTTGNMVDLSSVISGLNDQLGNIETALDNIIAIQTSLIGGES